VTVIWPSAILKPRHVSIVPAHATTAGPVALSGYRQAVESPAGVWSATMSGFRIVSPAEIKMWRALSVQIKGRVTPVVVPVFDRDELLPIIGPPGYVPHSDGSTHSDGTLYRTGRAQVITDQVVARGAVSMRVELISAAAIEPGMHFSVGHRLYRVESITAIAGSKTTMRFWPMAREAMIAGAELDFDTPVCKVRFVDDGVMDHVLDHGRTSFPQIRCIEDPG